MIDLNSLLKGMPGMSPKKAAALTEAAEYCLFLNKHAPGCSVRCESNGAIRRKLVWPIGPNKMQLAATHNDKQEATEDGAAAVAVAFAKVELGLIVTFRSPKDGGGCDYWLGEEGSEDELFQGKARLEVSGVLYSDDKECKARLQLKVAQVKKASYEGVDSYAGVVGFREPTIWAKKA